MSKKVHTHLSRRETQIMDAIYRLGEATVAEVLDNIPDPPGYNSVRVTLRILEEKGYLKHHREQQRFVYQPVVSREQAIRSALKHLLDTFFAGSTQKAVATLISMSGSRFTKKELDELTTMIQSANKGRRR